MAQSRKDAMEGANTMTGQVGKVKEPKNIVVIGAGIGGMCAAARLARAAVIIDSQQLETSVAPGSLRFRKSQPSRLV